MSAQRPVKYTLPAGKIQNVNLNEAEFIFLKEAVKPVDVTVNGQTIRMEAGEKRRFSMPIKEMIIQNPHTTPVRVVFIHGTGDYEKIIVSGNLNVSAYVISAANGESKSLPAEIVKEVGLASQAKTDVVGGTAITTSQAVGNPNYAFATFWWDDEFYGLAADKLYRLDQVNTGVVAETINLTPAIPADVKGAAINGRGEIYAYANNRIYQITLAGAVTDIMAGGTIMNLASTVGGGCIGDKVYFTGLASMSPDRHAIVEFDTRTKAIRTVAANEDTGTQIAVRDGKLYRRNIGQNTDCPVVNLDTLEVTETVENVPASNGDIAFSGAEGLYSTGDNFNFSVRHLESTTHYGKIWVQNVGDVTTRRHYTLREPYSFYPRSGKTVMVGRVLKALLTSIERQADSNYLDRVVSITYSDGLNTRKVSSGTQTWALREIEDDLGLALPSQVTLEVLPP